LVTRSGINIGENESPMPTDRFSFDYNYYDNTGRLGSGTSFDTHREMLQWEQTFPSSNASFGFRLPFVQNPGDGSLGLGGMSDLSLVTKFAFYDDPSTKNVVSGGVVFTFPTARAVHAVAGKEGPVTPDQYFSTIDDDLRTVLFQPWLGFILHADDWFFQGFSSIIMPSDWKDTVILTNSVCVGYTLYQSSSSPCEGITYLKPVVEAHLTTPLNNRGLDSGPISFPDICVATAGMHIGVGFCSDLTLAAAIPLTGPKPFDVEGIAQFTVRY